MTKFQKKPPKNPKNLILGPFLSVFKYYNYLSLCQKAEKTNQPFLIKMTDGCYFVGPSLGWGPIIKVTLNFP